MKFDRSSIMKQAWEIVRKLKNTISSALKMAWILAKKSVSLREEYYEMDGIVTFNIWSKGKYTRAYYTCSWKSKYQNSKGFFVEL